MWWCMPVIPVFGRLRKENLEFKVTLSYIPGLSKKKKKEARNKNILYRYYTTSAVSIN
jgi:hypothetical protein